MTKNGLRVIYTERALHNLFALMYMNLLTLVWTCSLNPESSAQGPQTVQDLPTCVGRSLRPGGCPKRLKIVVSRGYEKLRIFMERYFIEVTV
jgi:hypothetical protein